MGNTILPVNMAAELATLKHEMKNQNMKSLPPNTTVQRRPLHHPPVASPFAGADVQKVVYVSSHTPIMSAVKRVKKFLSHIEKRAIQSTSAKNQGHSRSMASLADASARIAKDNEEVLVKASGRAMEQALRVGEWFRTKEREIICNVVVRTSSAPAVDDIVQEEEGEGAIDEGGNTADLAAETRDQNLKDTTILEGGDTTMELLGNVTKSTGEECEDKVVEKVLDREHRLPIQSRTRQKKKRFRKRRAVYDKGEMPEARLRWVKTVEIAISLKG